MGFEVFGGEWNDFPTLESRSSDVQATKFLEWDKSERLCGVVARDLLVEEFLEWAKPEGLCGIAMLRYTKDVGLWLKISNFDIFH